MPLVLSQVVFDERAPELARIAEQVSEISGLPTSITDLSIVGNDDVSEFHGNLAFACEPHSGIELRAYRVGAMKKFYHETVGDPGLRYPMARFVQGLNEPTGTQAVHLSGHTGQDFTLFTVTLLALEKLGGRLRHPISDEDRRIYSTPITVSQLEDRCRKARRKAQIRAAVTFLLLPVIIPLWVLFLFLKLPLGVWYVWRHYGEFTKASK